MLRFEILPLEVLEKIFNFKIFESDINAIIIKYYFKNNISSLIKDFKNILKYDVKYYKHSLGEFKIYKSINNIKSFKWFKCVGCGKIDKNLSCIYFSCKQCFKMRKYNITKNLLLGKDRIPIIENNKPVLKDLYNGKRYVKKNILEEEDLEQLY